jgi:hypothetical protein
VLAVLTSWLDRREREVISYLVAENRLLRRQDSGAIDAVGHVLSVRGGALMAP